MQKRHRDVAMGKREKQAEGIEKILHIGKTLIYTIGMDRTGNERHSMTFTAFVTTRNMTDRQLNNGSVH